MIRKEKNKELLYVTYIKLIILSIIQNKRCIFLFIFDFISKITFFVIVLLYYKLSKLIYHISHYFQYYNNNLFHFFKIMADPLFL